jgi:hypothetical protein
VALLVNSGVTVAALAAVVLGGFLAVPGLTSRQAGMRTGANGFVNADRPSINAHNSPAAAQDPTRPRVVAVANRIDTPAFSCALSRSTNGGASWHVVDLPLASGAPNCYWPDVAFDGDGRMLVLYTATGGRFNRPVGVWLQAFDPQGAPDGPAVRVAGEAAFHARVAARGRRVLATWVQAGPASSDRMLGFAGEPNPVVVARSDDGGRTFAPPIALGAPGLRVLQPSIVLGQGDEVLVGALDLGDDRLNYEALHEGQGGPAPDGHWRVLTWSSFDGGASFGPPAAVADGLVVAQRIIPEFAPTPGFARDPASGRLYATWDAGRADDRDVFLAWSDDVGATWSPAVPVLARPGAQFLPAVAVAPDGRVDVLLYDRSRDPQDELAEVVLVSSPDPAAGSTAVTVSDRPFDSGIGLGSFQGIPVLSTQLALVADATTTLAFWADTRHGDLTSNIQDLAVAVVTRDDRWAPRWDRIGTGFGLIVLGGVVSARGRYRPSRPRSGREGGRRTRRSPVPAR